MATMIDTDPLLSQTIGNYKITGRLGRGGMSTVYRARQENMGRDVAIKMVSAELAGDPQFLNRFEREARVIANLEHPRILPVHEYGHQGGYFYLVMRLVDGESLRERLMHGPLSMAKAADFLRQIASALDYAHAKGVIHRDLKPNNILLDKLDNIYLMDFGIAKLVAASQQLTATGMVMGTPAYMAPESWRGEAVDARTDVYALGVILYEMVTSRPPFDSDTPFTLMYKHLNDQPPNPREWMPNLPEPVEAVIFKGLAKDPQARYQTAGELAADFSRAIHGVEDLVAPPLPVEEEDEAEAPAQTPPDEFAAQSTEGQAQHDTPPEAPSAAEERALARDELVPIPPPGAINPPASVSTGARTVPPIPVPGRGSGREMWRERGRDRRGAYPAGNAGPAKAVYARRRHAKAPDFAL